MAITTLQQYAENREDRQEQLRDRTRDDWNAAVEAEHGARDDTLAKRRELQVVEAALATIRTGLGASATPGQAGGLSDDLRDKLIEQRGLRAELLQLEQALADATGRRDRLQERLGEEQQALAESQRLVEQESEEATRRAQQLSTLTDTAIDELISQATALLAAVASGAPSAAEEDKDGVLIQAARDRVEGDIPAALRDRARARVAANGEVIAGMEALSGELLDAVDTHRGASMGTEGAVAPLHTRFERADQALRGFAIGAPGQVQSAQALLTQVRDSAALSADQQARINETQLAADAATALTLEATLTSAGSDLASAETALELALAAALIADPYANSDDHADVQSAASVRDAALSALSDAATALTTEERQRLDHWQVEVPDSIWANLVAYDQALVLLAVVANTDRTALADERGSAEEALALALEAADKADLAEQLVASMTDGVDTLHRALLDFVPARRLGAARGDR